MSVSDRQFNRLYGYVVQRVTQTPHDVAWYVIDDSQLVPITYQLLGACWLALEQHLQHHLQLSANYLTTRLPNCMTFALIDMICQSHSIVHFSIDPRTDQSTADELSHRLNAGSTIDTKKLHELLGLNCESHRNNDLQDDNYASLIAAASDFDLWLYRLGCKLLQKDATAISRLALRHSSTIEAVSTEQILDNSQSDHRLDQSAILMHSSGTTQKPKLILLSHRNIISNALGKLDAMPQIDSDRRLNLLPFAHAYARTCELATWAIAGGSICCVANVQQAETICEVLRPTLLNAVPLLLHRFRASAQQQKCFAKDQFLGGHLRMIASGGAGLDDDTFKAYSDINLPIHQGYGLTETSPVVCSNRFGDVKLNSIGPTIQGVELRADAEQQLWVRGPNLMLGYWGDPDHTAQRIKDGWLATGDVAEQLSNGHWRILGRLDERITLSNGYKVNPIELEKQLADLTGAEKLIVTFREQRLSLVCFVEGHSKDLEDKLRARLNEAIEKLNRSARPTWIDVLPWSESLNARLLNHKGQWNRKAVTAYLAQMPRG